jgi:two-component system sporulation sensor kinase B
MEQRKESRTSLYLPLVLSELERAETIINEYLSFAKPHLQNIEEVHLRTLLANF